MISHFRITEYIVKRMRDNFTLFLANQTRWQRTKACVLPLKSTLSYDSTRSATEEIRESWQRITVRSHYYLITSLTFKRIFSPTAYPHAFRLWSCKTNKHECMHCLMFNKSHSNAMHTSNKTLTHNYFYKSYFLRYLLCDCISQCILTLELQNKQTRMQWCSTKATQMQCIPLIM